MSSLLDIWPERTDDHAWVPMLTGLDTGGDSKPACTQTARDSLAARCDCRLSWLGLHQLSDRRELDGTPAFPTYRIGCPVSLIVQHPFSS